MEAVHCEPEGDWRGFDEFDVVDPSSASFVLEDLLDGHRDECAAGIADLTDLLDLAHDLFRDGDGTGGISALHGFASMVESMRDAGSLEAGFAADLLVLADVAVEWAGQPAVPEGHDWPDPWEDAGP